MLNRPCEFQPNAGSYCAEPENWEQGPDSNRRRADYGSAVLAAELPCYEKELPPDFRTRGGALVGLG